MKKLLSTVCQVLAILSATAQPYTPDPSFGNNGIITIGSGFTQNLYGSHVSQVMPLPDGSWYVLVANPFQAFVWHYLPDGSLDMQYGVNGYSASLRTINGAKAVLQPDGKVIIGGESYNYNFASVDFVLLRLTTDGMPDQSFGSNGRVITNIEYRSGTSSQDYFGALALQSDGKIVAGGNSMFLFFEPQNFVVVRYHPNGSLDSSFSTDGIEMMEMSPDAEDMNAIGVKSDGKIIAVGQVADNGSNRMAIACLNADGSPDAGFSFDGKEILYWGAETIGKALALQPDGKIVVAGSYKAFPDASAQTYFLIVRFNNNGTPDNSFSGDGIQTADFGTRSATAEAIALQADGKITVGGQVQDHDIFTDFGLARFNTNGTPDNSFDGDGIVTTAVDPIYDALYALAIDASGKILAGGALSSGNGGRYIVLRYQTNGSLDNSFDDDGMLTGFIPISSTQLNASAVQADGKIVVAGYAAAQAWWTENIEDEIIIFRLNTDGTLDDSFGNGGKLIVDYGTGVGNANAVAIQSDGKIVVAGYASNGSNRDFAMIRLNPDGTPDNNFGDGGKLLTDFGESEDNANAIVIQPDGKIVAGGMTHDWRTHQGPNFGLVRYNADGTLDSTFSGDGKTSTDFSTPMFDATHDHIHALVLQPDGKIVAAGFFAWWTLLDFAVARYNADGTLDPTFNGTGTVTTNAGSIDQIHAAALQPDGKIIVAGGGTGGYSNFGMARYNTNGTPDNSFDGDGVLTSDRSADMQAVIPQEDGKILVVGHTFGPTSTDMLLMRFNNDGTTDNSFGENGTRMIDFGGNGDRVASASVFGNRLYAVGTTDNRGIEGFVAAILLSWPTTY